MLIIIKFGSNERGQKSKDDFKHSKTVPSSAAILNDRPHRYKHEAILKPKTENNSYGPQKRQLTGPEPATSRSIADPLTAEP